SGFLVPVQRDGCGEGKRATQNGNIACVLRLAAQVPIVGYVPTAATARPVERPTRAWLDADIPRVGQPERIGILVRSVRRFLIENSGHVESRRGCCSCFVNR